MQWQEANSGVVWWTLEERYLKLSYLEQKTLNDGFVGHTRIDVCLPLKVPGVVWAQDWLGGLQG